MLSTTPYTLAILSATPSSLDLMSSTKPWQIMTMQYTIPQTLALVSDTIL